MKNPRNTLRYGIFCILVVLSLGYFPSQIGWNLFCMAMLICPFTPIRGMVDYVLGCLSKQGLLFLILLVYMGYYPLRDFSILMERITMIVEWFSNR